MRTNQFLIDHAQPNPELTDEEQNAVLEQDRERLKYMTFYCTTGDCLRAYILRYFGERADQYCGNCSNCRNGYDTVEITIEAQKILSCVARTGGRYGVKMIIDILKGSRSQRILSLGLDRQTTYGLLSGMPAAKIRAVIDFLISGGYADITNSEYPVLKLTERSRQILYGRETVEMKIPKESKTPIKAEESRNADSRLLSELKNLRNLLAKQAHVPAYVIFTDASLMDMCRKMPRTLDAFLSVTGVGEAKQKKYGQLFIDVIQSYKENDRYKPERHLRKR